MNNSVKKLTYTAMMAVVCYVVFSYGRIDIPLAGGKSTAIHLANAVVVVAGWLLGPVPGGLAGAIGLSIADVLDPRYITSAPKTFLMKFLIGFIAGKLAERLKLDEKESRGEIIKCCTVSAGLALLFNVIFDPIIGYFYKIWLLKIPAEMAAILATWSAGITALNAAICTLAAVLVYQAFYREFRVLKNNWK
ncbi:MAG: ECF transporter S component [Erysipelotrichaceae bacterium]|nr:ECF transporter S component [Erysipelotrichaceae bacterium]